MVLARRYCVEYVDGTVECFRDGFWYSTTGIIIKWAILGGIFLFFMAWFLGGYIHAKRRLRAGKPLLAYHRWLVSYNERKKYGQVPQNHFTFYTTQPYGPQQQQAYGPRPDGTWPEPPPTYNNDAPPGYPPPGATKMNPSQNHAMEMPQYGVPMGQQQTGVMGGDPEQQHYQQQQPPEQLPPRPQQAKLAFSNFVARFKK